MHKLWREKQRNHKQDTAYDKYADLLLLMQAYNGKM